MKISLISLTEDIGAIGIRSLSAYLEGNEQAVTTVFFRKSFRSEYTLKELNELVNLVKSSDLIGVSVMTNYFNNAAQMTSHLKKHTDALILWGGIHPTVRPKECLDYADIICFGEGEFSLFELIRRIKNGQDIYSTDGMWFKHKNGICKNPLAALVEDLNSLPFPAYNYSTQYILHENCIRKMDEALLKRYTQRHLPSRFISNSQASMSMYTYTTMTTRGCPFGCSYCFNDALNALYPARRKVRKKKIDYVIAELIEAKKKHPFIERITFEDDDFLVYTENEIFDFSKKYKEHINLPLKIAGVTPITLSKEKLTHLTNAGLQFLRMGIQTGSSRIKKMYKRAHTNQQVQAAADLINQFVDRIKYPEYDILIDNPWETEKDLNETFMLISQLPPTYKLVPFSLTFYPGTELYEKAKNERVITDDIRDVYRKDFWDSKPTYHNKLFFLVKEYSLRGRKIPASVRSVLLNNTCRKIGLSYFLYIMLRIRLFDTYFFRRVADFFIRYLKYLRQGNYSVVTSYIKRKIFWKYRYKNKIGSI